MENDGIGGIEGAWRVQIGQVGHGPAAVLQDAEIDPLVAVERLQIGLQVAAVVAGRGGVRNHRLGGFHPGHEGAAAGAAGAALAADGDGGGGAGGAEEEGVVGVEQGSRRQLAGADARLGGDATAAAQQGAIEVDDGGFGRAATAAGAHIRHTVLHGPHAHGGRQGQGVAEAGGQIHAGTGLAALGAELLIGHQVVEAEVLGTDRELRMTRPGGQAGQHGRGQAEAERVGGGARHRGEQQRLIEQHLLDHAAAEQHAGGDRSAGIEQAHRRLIGQQLHGNGAVAVGAVVIGGHRADRSGTARLKTRIAQRGRLQGRVHRHAHHPFDQLDLQRRVQLGRHRHQREVGQGQGAAAGPGADGQNSPGCQIQHQGVVVLLGTTAAVSGQGQVGARPGDREAGGIDAATDHLEGGEPPAGVAAIEAHPQDGHIAVAAVDQAAAGCDQAEGVATARSARKTAGIDGPWRRGGQAEQLQRGGLPAEQRGIGRVAAGDGGRQRRAARLRRIDERRGAGRGALTAAAEQGNHATKGEARLHPGPDRAVERAGHSVAELSGGLAAGCGQQVGDDVPGGAGRAGRCQAGSGGLLHARRAG